MATISRKRAKVLLCAGVVCTVLGAVSGAGAMASGAQVRHARRAPRVATSAPVFYVVGYVANNPFWNAEGKGAVAAGKLFHVTVRYEAPATATDAGMISIIDAALGTHPAGIAVDYTDKSMEAVVLKALADHVPVALYNNNRFEAQSGGATTNPAVTSLGFSGQNENTSGAKLADAYLKYLPKTKGGTVLLANAFPQAYVLSLRAAGIESVLHGAGYKTAILNMGPDSVTDEGLIGAYLTAHPGVVGIIGLSGDIEANAAAQWVQAHHLKLPIATFDVDPQTVYLMKTVPTYDLALDQQPYLQGFYAIANLALQVREGFAPVQVNTGSLLVTKQNLSSVNRLVKEGVD